MEYINAIFFILVLSGILWKMKADYLLVLFGFAAYLFLLFYIFKYSASELFLSILNLIVVNPYILLIFIIPPAINYIYIRIKKRSINSST